ncbi:Hypothetical_protein [Hexamita inflata]|uniref:Hypothetical_protein n=1 Tax=Hexamita inflata TaxID=28002 RepID=A0AA86V029_9EUKA|nr:Hypothetical protein HINF_LOCUS58577 [Hexamita inflata]
MFQLVQTPDSILQQQQTTLNTTEKRVDYTEQEKKIAALRLSRLGEQHYEEEREIQMKYLKVVIPSVSTAKDNKKWIWKKLISLTLILDWNSIQQIRFVGRRRLENFKQAKQRLNNQSDFIARRDLCQQISVF